MPPLPIFHFVHFWFQVVRWSNRIVLVDSDVPKKVLRVLDSNFQGPFLFHIPCLLSRSIQESWLPSSLGQIQSWLIFLIANLGSHHFLSLLVTIIPHSSGSKKQEATCCLTINADLQSAPPFLHFSFSKTRCSFLYFLNFTWFV